MDREPGKTVTKTELAAKVAEVGISRRHARQIVDFCFSHLAEALRASEIVHLVGFGSFHYKDRRPRRGRNPRTGQTVQVPAKRVVHFRAGSWLKSLVRTRG
jgi:nucleoid DNA-binding protein